MPRPSYVNNKAPYQPFSYTPDLGAYLTLIALFFMITLIPQAGAQILDSARLTPLPDSRLWIEGTTTVSRYACAADKIDGFGYLESESNETLISNRDQKVDTSEAVVNVTVGVKNLDCGKKGMNNDMYEALKANKHPNIHYHLLDAHLVNSPSAVDSAGWLKIQTVGELEIAGTRRKIEMVLNGQIIGNNRYRVRGSKKINMLDFGVQPPTALMGLVKAHKDLVVHFDLIVAPQNSQARRR